MPKVKLTIKESKCRCGYYKNGDSFIVEDICPPICHELWNSIYPSVYALLNGATLDYGNCKEKKFEMKCPDNGRVVIYGEVEESEVK
ncbi:TIGR04076 family protein [Clostridium faecium]|uniref:TIGR04076 family protein n=1 Tax=Clostridium faecium TaxID=2762223 RepID=A0ABR8YNV2_9CLOT|nr:TIGR04076 family protein [Clostridium faecium]MBD8045888.1 TIGR04076 family protein [Clostridium faecium]